MIIMKVENTIYVVGKLIEYKCQICKNKLEAFEMTRCIDCNNKRDRRGNPIPNICKDCAGDDHVNRFHNN